MKSILWLIALSGCLLMGDALAATRPIPDAGPMEVPDRTPQSDAVFDTLFANRGERVTGYVFIHGFAPGASRDIGADQLARIRSGGYLIGATDPERFDGRRNTCNLSQMNNISLGIARANFVNAMTGYRSTVLPQVIFNDRRGVYQVFTEPIVTSRPPHMAVRRDTVFLQPRLVTIGDSYSGRVWFRPSAGAGLISTDPVGFATPLVSLVGGIRLGQTDVGVYAMEGQTFQSDNRGLSRYGLQLGDELGWAFRLGYQSDWTELRGDGHTDRRREGGEVGVAYGTPVGSISGYFGLGWYADRRDRDGRIEPSLGLALNLGPVFRTGK